MEDISIALVWLGFFACLFFGWYFYLQARNKERMALIEKNAEVSEIYKSREIRFRFPWLKLGLIIIGIGLGFILTVILTSTFDAIASMGDEIAIGIMLLLGGIGVVIAHFIEKPKGN